MRADGVAVNGVGQVFGHLHDLLVGLQVRYQVKVIKTFGQDQEHIGVVLLVCRFGAGLIVLRHCSGLGGGVLAVAVRLQDGVHHQAGGFNATRQVAVLIIGFLPGPAVSGGGLDGVGAEIPQIQHRKNAAGAGQRMGAALFPAALMLAGQFDLHNGSHQHRDVQQRNGNNCLGNVQGITAHHLCRGAQVQDVLRHQGGTMQVPRVIVDQRQHGKNQAGNAGCNAPAAAQGKHHQRQAERRQRIERCVYRPLPCHVVSSCAVRNF